MKIEQYYKDQLYLYDWTKGKFKMDETVQDFHRQRS